MTTIRKIPAILILTLAAALSSCKSTDKKSDPVWSDLPKVTNLESLKQTDFVITLENPISEKKNIIYAPAFLYAWDKIKEQLKSPIIVDPSSTVDFKLLNQSISHQNSLTDKEYSATAEIVDDAIIARAFFNKTLPFDIKLQVLDDPINFDKTTKVSAFGMYFHYEELISFTKVIYYQDDEHFILKLLPKDKDHEIILVKGLEKYQTLKDAIKLTNDLIIKGKQEQTDNNLLWKYQILEDDIFAIPVIKFNIETRHKNIEGQAFSTQNNKKHSVEEAYQRTGFIFNENGAVIEDENRAAVDSAGPQSFIMHPKKMIFDNSFLIIIKRVDKTNPYFMMKVANTELMLKK